MIPDQEPVFVSMKLRWESKKVASKSFCVRGNPLLYQILTYYKKHYRKIFMTTIGDGHQNSTFQRYCQTKKVASREIVFVVAICDATPKSLNTLCKTQLTSTDLAYTSYKQEP